MRFLPLTSFTIEVYTIFYWLSSTELLLFMIWLWIESNRSFGSVLVLCVLSWISAHWNLWVSFIRESLFFQVSSLFYATGSHGNLYLALNFVCTHSTSVSIWTERKFVYKSFGAWRVSNFFLSSFNETTLWSEDTLSNYRSQMTHLLTWLPSWIFLIKAS